MSFTSFHEVQLLSTVWPSDKAKVPLSKTLLQSPLFLTATHREVTEVVLSKSSVILGIQVVSLCWVYFLTQWIHSFSTGTSRWMWELPEAALLGQDSTEHVASLETSPDGTWHFPMAHLTCLVLFLPVTKEWERSSTQPSRCQTAGELWLGVCALLE